MSSKEHKHTGKYRPGIGGIICPCCTVGPKRVTKQGLNRTFRRRKKQELLDEQKQDQQPTEDR